MGVGGNFGVTQTAMAHVFTYTLKPMGPKLLVTNNSDYKKGLSVTNVENKDTELLEIIFWGGGN